MRYGLSSRRVCIPFGDRGGIGGPASFLSRLRATWARHGIETTQDLDNRPYDAVLVFSGTRQLADLQRLRRAGIRIVQRLNGLNWMHRVRSVTATEWLRAEALNALMQFTRQRVAHRVVYQSEFSRQWWESRYGPTRVRHEVIHNAVDLNEFTPRGDTAKKNAEIRIVVVETSIHSGYELGLEPIPQIRKPLSEALSGASVEIVIAGAVDGQAHARLDAPGIRWAGLIDPDKIPMLDRSADLFYSADINAACPNSVIEALACGTPVVGYATGALGELIPKNAGAVVDYAADPWRLERPRNLDGLINAAAAIIKDKSARQSARVVAEQRYGIEMAAAKYAAVLFEN